MVYFDFTASMKILMRIILNELKTIIEFDSLRMLV